MDHRLQVPAAGPQVSARARARARACAHTHAGARACAPSHVCMHDRQVAADLARGGMSPGGMPGRWHVAEDGPCGLSSWV